MLEEWLEFLVSYPNVVYSSTGDFACQSLTKRKYDVNDWLEIYAKFNSIKYCKSGHIFSNLCNEHNGIGIEALK
jgi:hypothetical protein